MEGVWRDLLEDTGSGRFPTSFSEVVKHLKRSGATDPFQFEGPDVEMDDAGSEARDPEWTRRSREGGRHSSQYRR